MFHMQAERESALARAPTQAITVVYAPNLPQASQVDAQTEALLDPVGMPLDDITITDQAKFLLASLPGGQIVIPRGETAATLKFRWAPFVACSDLGVVWRLYASVRGNHDPLRWRTLLSCISLQGDTQEQTLLCPWATWPLSLECLGLAGVFLHLGEGRVTQRLSSWAAVKVTELRLENRVPEAADPVMTLARAA